MPQQGVPGYLSWRVVDQNSGAEVVGNLPHLHQSVVTVRAMQKGFPAAAQIGDFRILLPPPQSDLHRQNRYLYDKLVEGQKVEGYLGDVITGTPRFSGVITKITKNRKDPWVIEGPDTLWWLQQSQTFPGEQVAIDTGGQTALGFLGTEEIVWSDNFPTNLSSYTNGGSFAQNGSDPYLSLSNAQISGITTSQLVTTTTWAKTAQYVNCAISMRGTVVAGTAATKAANFGILLLSDSTGANAILVNVQIDSTAGAAPYSAHLQIFTISGGAFTQQAQVLNVFTGLNATLQFELTAIVNVMPWLGTTTVRALLNGKDPGCTYTAASPGGTTPGSIGIRYAPSTGGSPVLYVNNLQFEARTSAVHGSASFGTNRFAAGNITLVGSTNINQVVNFSGQSYLDVLMLLALIDGFFIRKNPGFGFKADSIDYAATPGTDLSSSIVLNDQNIVDGFVGPVPDIYATNARFNAIRGNDSGGTVTWPRFGSIGDMVLRDTTQDVGAPGFRWMMAYAQQVQARKASPSAATQLEIVRTPDVADKFRELDYVLVDDPTLGINRQKSLVMGYQFREGDANMTVYLSQFSAQGLPKAPLWFMNGAVEWLGSIYANR